MRAHYAEVFASENQADIFEYISRESEIIPNVIQRQGVEVIVEEVDLNFEEMSRPMQYDILADLSRGMKFISENNVYNLDIKKDHIGSRDGSGVLIDWSDAYYYGQEIENERFYMTHQPSNINKLIKDPSQTNLENGLKSIIGLVMDEIGAPKASQVYNMPHRYTFEDIADILEEP